VSNTREPATPLVPVEARRGGRDVVVIVLLLVGALITGVAVGFRMGSQSNHTAVLPTPGDQPTPAPAPTRPLTPEPTFAPYPVQIGLITEELRSAYYRVGAGISVCVGYTDIICRSRSEIVPVEPIGGGGISSAEFESLFSAGPVVELKPDSTFVVEDLGDRYVEGVLLNETNFQNDTPQKVIAVNPGGAGIFFMSLSGIDLGRSVLVVRSIPLAPLRPDQGLEWEANVIAFEMTR
jgi:hypothetical protein